MRFGIAQTTAFGTARGSYSVVTTREVVDSQVTLTDYEAELALSHFGTIHMGKVGLDRAAAAKSFRHYLDGTPLMLNLVYPKPGNPELRLYLSAEKGFKPNAGDTWFMYESGGEMFIGSLPEIEWQALMTGEILDRGDGAYAELVDAAEIRTTTIAEREVYGRRRSVALQAFESAGYRCEIDPSHALFTSRSTGRAYLEPHHLIPISLQSHFPDSLDTPLNVFALCPHCHRAIHYADSDTIRGMLRVLAARRPVVARFGIDEQRLFSLYSVGAS